MWEYRYTDELYHHGVKGMRWGVRRVEKKFAKKLSRAGRVAGMGAYEREQGSIAVRKHENNARILDKSARQFEKNGQYFRAEAARRAASALRTRGANIKAQHDETAAKYELKADKLQQKATAFATKKKVNAGKDVVNSILKNSKQKGYEQRKSRVEYNKEADMRERLGDRNYDTYSKIRDTVRGTR